MVVPCRQIVKIQWGQVSQDFTLSRTAEQGIVTNVYGYNGSTYFQGVRNQWEFYTVDEMKVTWCPSNIRGDYGNISTNFSQ
jgi:hypothetical protein